MKLTPHLVAPDAAEAADWYQRAFGAVEVSRIPLPGDRVMAVELTIGDSAFNVGSEFPDFGILSPLTMGGTATVLQIDTDDADALWGRAVEADTQVSIELSDTLWGERHSQLIDSFGHRWNIVQKIPTPRMRKSWQRPPRFSEARPRPPCPHPDRGRADPALIPEA